jgi:CRISPR type IV-associated protein Csf2
MQKRDITIEGIITLLAPLSHIGETRGTDSLLVRSVVLDERGQRRETFMYNGNAFRGMLRDHGALYLFEKLNNPKMSLDTLYFFTAGGTIVGEQSVDLARAEAIRKAFPLASIFGGGAKSQVLEGKICVGFGIPLVRECQRILPERFRDPESPPWRLWTEERYFTRMDDAKRETFKQFLAEAPAVNAGEEPKQLTGRQELLDESGSEVKEAPRKPKEHAQQMRAMVECLAAGARLYQRIDLYDVTELELGAFVSCLDHFSRKPYIGGKSGVGFGLCKIDYDYWENGELKHFMSINENNVRMCALAEAAEKKYDRWLLDIYQHYLAEKQQHLLELVEAGK